MHWFALWRPGRGHGRGLEYLNTMILAIAYQNIAIGHNGHALESFELRVTGAPRAEGL